MDSIANHPVAQNFKDTVANGEVGAALSCTAPPPR